MNYAQTDQFFQQELPHLREVSINQFPTLSAEWAEIDAYLLHLSLRFILQAERHRQSVTLRGSIGRFQYTPMYLSGVAENEFLQALNDVLANGAAINLHLLE